MPPATSWPVTGPPRQAERLRERRKRELRQQLSDTATQMFLDRGFDAVRVADVARACGVTEKTVFNHFRSKESLLADRWDAQTDALLRRLADPSVSPVDAAVQVLEQELNFLTSSSHRSQPTLELAAVRRFSELIRTTPSLIAHNREQLDRLTAAAAAVLAERSATAAEDPEPWIRAIAIAGLWTVYAHSLHRNLRTHDAGQLAHAVRDDLHRAAAALHQGI